jgi:hypothetical protein
MFNTENLTPMQKGRLEKALDKQYRFSDGIRTLRAEIERRAKNEGLEKDTCDGMLDYNRTRFNRMNGAEQREYMARLKAKRYYFVNNLKVPKIVFDAIAGC